MVPYLDGRAICEKCGHLALPGDANFKCSCIKCVELNSSRIHSNVSSVLKINPLAS